MLCMLLLIACGDEQYGAPDDKDAPLEKMIETQLDGLQKAKEVEGSLNQQKLDRDKRMVEQGG